MDNYFYIRTYYLREQISEITEDKNTALQLHYCVSKIQQLSDPIMQPKYDSILNSINGLIAYFQKMADTIEMIEEDTIDLSKKISILLEEGTDEVNRENSKVML